MSVFQEGDIKFEEVPNLGAEREDLLKNAPNPVLARDWLANALSEGTRVHDAYRKGRFPLGVDVVNLLYGFDYEYLKCPGLAANEIQERRRRAYHRLLGHLLASYEYTAAAKVAANLRDAEEGLWLSYRHLFLWRLLAGTVAGSIALGGSSTWREMTVALARGPACCVVTLSLLLILARPS